MIRVKICGVTRPDDARVAVEAGADAVGLNFWRGSKRFIGLEAARAIVATLPSEVLRIGVFVDAGFDEIVRIATALELDNVQLHGDEPPELLVALDGLAFKAIRLRDDGDLARIPAYLVPPDPVFLIDTFDAEAPGGTGLVGRWDLARQATKLGRLLLAGGLTPENVAAALDSVHPWGVDTASGVESAPGIKDPARVRAFVDAVRRWERDTFQRLRETDDE
ncbi:MAG: phosphoribosylanthranilate isomerase [Myxococcales bacterium]|nr:phosphoribosylanthranilate isomerase [Myxococcales bacterium]